MHPFRNASSGVLNNWVGRKPCQTLPPYSSTWKCVMSSSYLTCPSCKKMNGEGSRYCIQCGGILIPIYCSACGTKNPDGIERCLECGSSIPTLAGLRWNPTVTVLNPTGAMTETKQPSTEDRSLLKRLRAKVDRDRTTKTSASNRT